ncbi:MAG: type II toxin-antitoxin system RelE/ParE family toxin [Nitrospirae bacterium]|nr:type II toxin-antitoxin system RelE/ParE family toxin [Nitrospirota bacterium]
MAEEGGRVSAYTVRLKKSAEKELDSIVDPNHRRIVKRLEQLGLTPRPPGTKKLQGSDGYRIRVGDFRILYLVDDQAKAVEVTAVGHRREVYR